jgi:hypothetical protein
MIKRVQQIIGILVGIITSVSLFLIPQFSKWWMLLLFFCFWLIFIFLAHWLLKKIVILRNYLPLLSTATMFAFIGLIIFVEYDFVRWFIVVFGGIILGILFGWSVEKSGYTTHIEKSYRRMVMMLWVFDAYAILTSIFAISMFFEKVPFWILSIIGGAVLTGVSYMIWHMYFTMDLRSLVLWLSCIFILSVELMWVFSLLPLGYTVLGLFVAWVWYIVQLLFRFHFSRTGVIWKNQTIFLIINGVLMSLILYLARWI